MRFLLISTTLMVVGMGTALAADKEPQPTDPMSSSRAPDSKPTTGHSTFDAPDKPTGPWGEIPGGGGPSGYNDSSGQKAPQYEGEKYKTAQQSEQDATAKGGGLEAPNVAHEQPGQHSEKASPSTARPNTGTGSEGAGRKEHHQTISPEHLGPQGGSTADSGKAKHDERAKAEQEASKSNDKF